MPPTNDPTNVTPKDVFDKAADLLKTNRGLFLGEAHSETLALGFIAAHAHEFKKLGVTTLYIEVDMYSAAARQAGADCSTPYEKANGLPQEMIQMEAQMQLAKMSGLRVIGHDDVTDKARLGPSLDELAKTGAALDRRDDFAKKVIEQTYDGQKFIVYGGSAHSGNEMQAERP